MRTRLNPGNVVITLSATGVILAGIVIGATATPRNVIAQSQANATAKTEQSARTSGDEAGVRDLLKKITGAYNKGDAPTISALFQEDAILIDSDGIEIKGRDAIETHYKAAFDGGPPAEISGALKSSRFPSPDIASIHGEFRLLDTAGGVFATGRFGLLAAREKGTWKIAELRDHSIEMVEDTGRPDRLKDLEWLVGDWVDESRDMKIESNVRWAEGRRYLIRTYNVHVSGQSPSSATQWIGWDPRVNQIRSWIFDSDGGFGEGLWTRSNDGWVVKTSGTLPDGGATSATLIIDSIGKHSVEIRSVHRILGDMVQPDLPNIVMVRKPPAPDSGRPGARPSDEPKSN